MCVCFGIYDCKWQKNLAEEHIEKYKIEINGQIVTRVNERPDYDKYITIKDKKEMMLLMMSGIASVKEF